jgi:inorganic pyrophosphatase
MPASNYPQEIKRFEIEVYQRPKNLKELRKTHVAFSGSPIKHPYDAKKIVLVIDPYSTHTSYYEFRTRDISFVEELPSIVDLEGKTVPMARIWVKKRSVGMHGSLFSVGETKR